MSGPSKSAAIGPDSPLRARVKLALRALDVAIAGMEPLVVRALFSGGGDSMVAAHVAAQHDWFGGCVFIDTGTALPGVLEHAQMACEEQGWPLTVVRSPQSYEDMIARNGLPGPGQHPTAYVRLKEKALDAHVRALCLRCQKGERHIKHDTVMWISGARADESVRRMGNGSWLKRDGSQVWVNPILDWTSAECETYRQHFGLRKSDVAALVHRSGECNCGTYASKGEREMLRSLFPEFAEQMDRWEQLARENGHERAAVWGERPKRMPDSAPTIFDADEAELFSGTPSTFAESSRGWDGEKPRCGELACSDCAGRMVALDEGLEESA